MWPSVILHIIINLKIKLYFQTDSGLDGAIKYCQQECALLKQQATAIPQQQTFTPNCLSILPSSSINLPVQKTSTTPEIAHPLSEVVFLLLKNNIMLDDNAIFFFFFMFR